MRASWFVIVLVDQCSKKIQSLCENHQKRKDPTKRIQVRFVHALFSIVPFTLECVWTKHKTYKSPLNSHMIWVRTVTRVNINKYKSFESFTSVRLILFRFLSLFFSLSNGRHKIEKLEKKIHFDTICQMEWMCSKYLCKNNHFIFSSFSLRFFTWTNTHQEKDRERKSWVCNSIHRSNLTKKLSIGQTIQKCHIVMWWPYQCLCGDAIQFDVFN